MNNVLEYIYNHPKETKRIIGITDKQLIKLIENAQKVEDKKRQAIASGEKRLIKAGGGRKKSLGKAEEIILTLYYLHHVPTFQLLGAIFGVSESTANNIFHYWIDILRELLPSSLLDEFSGKENEYLWIKEALTEIELIVDSTEQDIFRPKNDEKQKKYYSGKQKSHTLKNQIIITDNGKEIVDVIVGERGPESDIILFKKQQKKFDKEQRFQGDKGYQGGEIIDTPKKKKETIKCHTK